ncbi:glutamate racemase [Thermotomaculum hydrothermale]|uniref:Glutamate racemase n=1 Tax=Thermotomaculum hydrothermale TaxID=981385 RepID=A0A7R6SZ61_9BACT|nr:glutamate racemase [Thermotomaculum hydrothermale]BBB32490.1 glutamate racemase [Thermotomaculum hydrothermale]
MRKKLIKKIGIFDSGAGGLTVLKKLRKNLKGVEFYYLGDTARLPYGTKSSETIVNYTLQNVDFLRTKDIEILIVACNTASAYSIPHLKTKLNIPVYGVIKAGAKKAVKVSENKRIGIIGTRATILSNSYQDEIKKLCPECEIFSNPAPLLVPLVEEGLIEGEIAEKIVSIYVMPLIENKIDTLVLGCTHYPVMKKTIGKIVGEKIKLVDSATPILEILKKSFIFPKEGENKTEIYVTDYPENFGKLSEKFLEGNFDKIEHIDLQKYRS